MKTSVSFAYCLAIAMMVFAPNCGAQQPYVSGAIGAGGQICEPTAGVATGMAAYQMPFPGRVWFGTNIADQAVGSNGIYASLGLKTRLCEDFLDGRWLSEVRLHQSLDGGGFFTNIGLERVFSIDAANADVTVGAWFDYDAGTNSDFTHTFYQVGVNASIKSRNWDLIGNGYFPTDKSGYTQGDPNGNVPFYGHHIVLLPGIDSALEGFDATLRIRPSALGYVNGSIDVGGYGYSSDIIKFFAGGRTRLNAQLWDGLIVSGEISYDDRFDLTGGVNLTYMYGVNARGSEYAGIGRDLERTVRNDHIVRYNQDVVFAIDPDTGAPYNVIHVNNGERPALVIADGSFEAPFFSLADAEAASGEQTIIWVDEGDGTTDGYASGIQLRNGQMLLGDGVRHRIPIANGPPWGPFFELVYHLDNNLPAITGSNNDAAVRLANNNVVRGFIIDGNQSTTGMSYGIMGDGLARGQDINNAIIEDNVINGAILDGVNIVRAEGELVFKRNLIGEFSVGPGPDLPNGGSGIYIEDFVGPLDANGNTTGSLVLQENNIVGNLRDGVELVGYRLQHRDRSLPLEDQEVGILAENNNISNNLRDGIRLEANLFTGNPLETTDIDLIGNTTTLNGGNGINIFNELVLGMGPLGGGRLRVLEGTSSSNAGAGVRIVNWTNMLADDSTMIASRTDGPTSVITNNGRGVEVLLGETAGGTLNGFNQNLVVQAATIDNNNGVGVRATVNGVGTTMETQIVDNLGINSNGGGGIRLTAIGGSTHRAIVENSAAAVGGATLEMDSNGANGLGIVAGNDSAGVQSVVEAVIRNVAVTNSGNHGIDIAVSDDGHAIVFAENILSAVNAGHGMNIISGKTSNAPPLFEPSVSVITLKDSFMDFNGGNGLTLATSSSTKTDLLITGSTFNANQGTLNQAAASVNPILRTGHGVEITATTTTVSPLPPELENYTRVQIYGSEMDSNTRSGLALLSRGRANLYATIDSNRMTNNGFTFEELDLIFFRIPYVKLNDRGVDVSAWDNSRMTVDMSNNLINGNGEEGLAMFSEGLSNPAGQPNLLAMLKDNAILNNDQWAETTVPKIANERDIVMVNQFNSQFHLAMSNNSITIVPSLGGAQSFFNLGPLVNFKIGLDGVTNGFTSGDLVGNFEFTNPYDSVVGPELLAVWADFLAEGFPLMPSP